MTILFLSLASSCDKAIHVRDLPEDDTISLSLKNTHKLDHGSFKYAVQYKEQNKNDKEIPKHLTSSDRLFGSTCSDPETEVRCLGNVSLDRSRNW